MKRPATIGLKKMNETPSNVLLLFLIKSLVSKLTEHNLSDGRLILNTFLLILV